LTSLGGGSRAIAVLCVVYWYMKWCGIAPGSQIIMKQTFVWILMLSRRQQNAEECQAI
jgi:hypothetical protein